MKTLICMLLLLTTALWPDLVEAATVTAVKNCSVTPCSIVGASFTISFNQTVQWSATYTNPNPASPGGFYLTQNPGETLPDIILTTTGQASGSIALTAGTYYISIRNTGMRSGSYTIDYNSSSTGEPHITTINGARYDFQAAGEFIFLRQPEGLEIQVRQTPVATQSSTACVSINTAVAARVGKHRVSYEPNLNGEPDPNGLQLRIDGKLTDLDERVIDLGNRSRITKTNVDGGLRIDFPDRSYLSVTPGWWANQGKWYLNLDFAPAGEGFGLAGTIGPDTWLPLLPDGSSMGPLPRTSHDRYVALYQKFADAWRVTNTNSLFDYASGTSTSTFTNRSWPSEHPPCDVPGTTPADTITEDIARAACQGVKGSENANCVYDVMVTGNPGFATTYALSQSLTANPVCERIPLRLICILLGLLLSVVIALLIYLLKRKKAVP